MMAEKLIIEIGNLSILETVLLFMTNIQLFNGWLWGNVNWKDLILGRKSKIQEYIVDKYDPIMKFKENSTIDADLNKWIDSMHLNTVSGGIYPKDKIIDNIVYDEYYVIKLDDSTNRGHTRN